MSGGESKKQKNDKTLSIFNPKDNRSSDDITRNILDFLDADTNRIKEIRTTNRVFASGGRGLLPEVIRADSNLDNAIAKYRVVRKRYPDRKIQILIKDTGLYRIGDGSIVGTEVVEYSHKIEVRGRSDYRDLRFLPRDLTNLVIVTPEIEITCDRGALDVLWKIGDVPPVCFAELNTLRSVKLNANVTRIGIAAFAGCSNLSSVNLEDTNVRTIHERAFIGTGRLTVKTPPSLSLIAFNAFRSSNVNYVYFNSSPSLLISEQAFQGCEELNEVHFPDFGQVIIGPLAFVNCPILYYADITPAVVSIQRMAFFNCVRLGSVNINSSDVDIAQDAYGDNTVINRGKNRCNMGSCVLQLRF